MILNETLIPTETPILNEVLSEFSVRNQKKAATIIKAVELTPGILIDPKTLTMSVNGKKVGSGNILHFMHVLLTPMYNSPPSEGMKTILSNLAMDGQLSSHTLTNLTLWNFMNQQCN